MAAVKAGDVDRALRYRRADTWLVLVYGPDAGGVSERARMAAESGSDDPSDPFGLIKLDGDAVAEQPGRLVEEVTTFSLFGGRRVVWVRQTSRDISGAVSACLSASPADTLVVIEAGNLAKTSPLRQVCEASPAALACPCYADEGRDLGTVVDEALSAARIAIDREARQLLVAHLGGDRLASRGELAKLVLYAGNTGRITAEDVEAVVSDVSSLGMEAVLDHAFLGRDEQVGSGLVQLAGFGIAPAALLSQALRHALALLAKRALVEDGTDPEGVIKSWRELHFRRRDTAKRQLRIWSSDRLRAVVASLQSDVLGSRQTASLAGPLASVALFRVAALARRSLA